MHYAADNRSFAARKRLNGSGHASFGGFAGILEPTPHVVVVSCRGIGGGRVSAQVVPQQSSVVHALLDAACCT